MFWSAKSDVKFWWYLTCNFQNFGLTFGCVVIVKTYSQAALEVGYIAVCKLIGTHSKIERKVRGGNFTVQTFSLLRWVARGSTVYSSRAWTGIPLCVHFSLPPRACYINWTPFITIAPHFSTLNEQLPVLALFCTVPLSRPPAGLCLNALTTDFLCSLM